MAKVAKKTTKTAAAKPAKKSAPAKSAKKPVAAKAAPVKTAPVAKAAWGEKSNILKALFTRKSGASAAEIKAETGWKSVSAKALADRFAATWGKVDNESAEGERDGKPYKVVAVKRGEGEPVAYRWA